MVQTINTTHNISDESDGLPMPKRIWAVVSVGFALCMSVLDINIVNIVLPTLSHDFGTTPAVTTWIINGYQLAIVISLLSFSALGEMIGYRKVFLSGIGLFCITSLICALSDSFWTLTVARIFQGFSASAITSVNTAQLRYIYPKSQIGRGWELMRWWLPYRRRQVLLWLAVFFRLPVGIGCLPLTCRWESRRWFWVSSIYRSGRIVESEFDYISAMSECDNLSGFLILHAGRICAS